MVFYSINLDTAGTRGYEQFINSLVDIIRKYGMEFIKELPIMKIS